LGTSLEKSFHIIYYAYTTYRPFISLTGSES